MASVLKIELPWPHSALSPNGRPHYYTKAAQTKKHVKLAWGAAKEQLPPCFKHNGERITVRLTFHPKPKGPEPDKDNCIASCKAYLDGLAMALGVNDSLFDIAAPVIAERGSKVVIEI